ncbi:hypothetical protein GWN26_15190 [Candidatus Saccharibacteria bacterium]|nr:hypothetical protein [Candidatus Saccharibacteria bacterium]NIW79426.1 hypothetical protein [Calditrichia bacterium]
MYYEINVSQHGQHYFATSERSIRTKEQAEKMFEHFSDLFPAADGYEIRVTRYQKTGEQIFQNG